MHVESVFLRDGRWIFYIKRVEIYIYIYIYIFAWLLTKKQQLTQNAENLFFFSGVKLKNLNWKNKSGF